MLYDSACPGPLLGNGTVLLRRVKRSMVHEDLTSFFDVLQCDKTITQRVEAVMVGVVEVATV